MVQPVTVPPSSDYGIRNPFRVPALRKQFDAMVWAYATNHRDLIRPNGVRPGNAWAMHFWRGFDGVPRPKLDNLKDTPSYACWKAGVTIRAKGLVPTEGVDTPPDSV